MFAFELSWYCRNSFRMSAPAWGPRLVFDTPRKQLENPTPNLTPSRAAFLLISLGVRVEKNLYYLSGKKKVFFFFLETPHDAIICEGVGCCEAGGREPLISKMNCIWKLKGKKLCPTASTHFYSLERFFKSAMKSKSDRCWTSKKWGMDIIALKQPPCHLYESPVPLLSSLLHSRYQWHRRESRSCKLPSHPPQCAAPCQNPSSGSLALASRVPLCWEKSQQLFMGTKAGPCQAAGVEWTLQMFPEGLLTLMYGLVLFQGLCGWDCESGGQDSARGPPDWMEGSCGALVGVCCSGDSTRGHVCGHSAHTPSPPRPYTGC